MIYELGYAESRPIYFINEKGELILFEYSINAITPEARIGYKAGNLLLDEYINLIKEIEKIVEFSKLEKKVN